MSRDALCDFMDILLSLLRDAVYEKLGKNTFRNIDAKAIKNRVAEHFTTAEIQCMITETLQRRRILTEYGDVTMGVTEVEEEKVVSPLKTVQRGRAGAVLCTRSKPSSLPSKKPEISGFFRAHRLGKTVQTCTRFAF